jgi:hypothetical protein
VTTIAATPTPATATRAASTPPHVSAIAPEAGEEVLGHVRRDGQHLRVGIGVRQAEKAQQHEPQSAVAGDRLRQRHERSIAFGSGSQRGSGDSERDGDTSSDRQRSGEEQHSPPCLTWALGSEHPLVEVLTPEEGEHADEEVDHQEVQGWHQRAGVSRERRAAGSTDRGQHEQGQHEHEADDDASHLDQVRHHDRAKSSDDGVPDDQNSEPDRGYGGRHPEQSLEERADHQEAGAESPGEQADRDQRSEDYRAVSPVSPHQRWKGDGGFAVARPLEARRRQREQDEAEDGDADQYEPADTVVVPERAQREHESGPSSLGPPWANPTTSSPTATNSGRESVSIASPSSCGSYHSSIISSTASSSILFAYTSCHERRATR